jgi:outer membrane protein assembly factor BamB
MVTTFRPKPQCEAFFRLLSARTMAVMAIAISLLSVASSAGNSDWPSFRGVHASGVSDHPQTPTRWDVPKQKNVLWKTTIPGLGLSSPVAWGDRVFITTAVSAKAEASLVVGLYGSIMPVSDDAKHSWWLYCLDKNNGAVLWKQKSHEAIPAVKRHPKSSHANSTPATDGKHVLAFYGSEGLYCYDMAGSLLWKKDFGVLDSGYYMVPQAQWGFGSSPVIHDGKVIVQCDVQKAPFIAMLDVRTGREIWRVSRSDVPTWSTPTVHESDGRKQILANGYNQIAGYDFATGDLLWHMKGGGDIPVPTPIVAHGLVFITNAHGGLAPVYAIRVEAKGDISLKNDATSNEFVAWSTPRSGAYMQTPIVYGDLLYTCMDNGVVTCFRAKTGEQLYRTRLADGSTGFTASSIASNGHIYFTSEEGDVHVVKAGPQFEVVAINPLGEVAMATPAISEGVLFFRTRKHVVAIGAVNDMPDESASGAKTDQ